MDVQAEVHVSIGGATIRAGTLYTRRNRGVDSATFSYDPQYVGHPDAFALSPELSFEGGTHHTGPGQGLFGVFEDCSPDRWGRTLIQRREKARAREADEEPRSMSAADYLLGVRDDLRQGAARFRLGADGPFLATEETGIPALTDLPELLHLAQRAEEDDAEYEELMRLVRAGSSLGGARPKAHVRGRNGEIAIAKFPSASADEWNVMAWERVALDLAARAGIVVPDSELVTAADRHVLVVDRFDRTTAGERIAYASAMTMLGAQDHDQRSYLEIAEVIETQSPAASAELEQLWRRIAFSVAIANTDDHLRNHGFLHVGNGHWELAPAFDINPNPEPGPKYLSTAIDEAETRASTDLVMDVAGWFRLDAQRAKKILGQVSTAVAGWREAAAGVGLSKREISGMEPAFDKR
jgi:serine/threonine-protein kinase HipA